MCIICEDSTQDAVFVQASLSEASVMGLELSTAHMSPGTSTTHRKKGSTYLMATEEESIFQPTRDFKGG